MRCGEVGGGVGGSCFCRSCSSSAEIRRDGFLDEADRDDVDVLDDSVTSREMGRPCELCEGTCVVYEVFGTGERPTSSFNHPSPIGVGDEVREGGLLSNCSPF